MQYLYCSCAQKQQEAFVEDNELNKEDRELYSVVTLRSGRQLGAQKNKEQRTNKTVKDDDEEQEDEGQSSSCDVMEVEALIQGGRGEESVQEVSCEPIVGNSVSQKQEDT